MTWLSFCFRFPKKYQTFIILIFCRVNSNLIKTKDILIVFKQFIWQLDKQMQQNLA